MTQLSGVTGALQLRPSAKMPTLTLACIQPNACARSYTRWLSREGLGLLCLRQRADAPSRRWWRWWRSRRSRRSWRSPQLSAGLHAWQPASRFNVKRPRGARAAALAGAAVPGRTWVTSRILLAREAVRDGERKDIDSCEGDAVKALELVARAMQRK